MSAVGAACPACAGSRLEVFHEQRRIPVNSCLLVETKAEALAFPTGDLRLATCHDCGFITNVDFDPTLATYSDRYEETQGFSARFRDFTRSLAQRWIDRYGIHGRDVLEIGCGKGEFLALMCELGGNRGVGIDPSAIPERLDATNVSLLPEVFADEHAALPADVVVCRHTLEHIAPVGDFLRQVRRVIGDRLDTVVLFELPDVLRVLREVAFWDIYYEHCSYFSPGSLVRLFRRACFEVLNVELDFDDQYILLEARPATAEAPAAEPMPGLDAVPEVLRAAEGFRVDLARQVDGWRAMLATEASAGNRVAIWGGGSKGVSYLTTLGTDAVDYAVDINPRKQGRYLAGTGHRVLGPQDLPGPDAPGLVVAMNAIYTEEIRDELQRLGLPATVRAV